MSDSKKAPLFALCAVLSATCVAFLLLRFPDGEEPSPRPSPARDDVVAQAAALAVAAVSGAPPEASPTATESTGGREAAEAPRVTLASLTNPDRDRFAFVNAVLKSAGLPEIDQDSSIAPEDIAAFRDIVDAANRGCDKALNGWRKVAEERLDLLKNDLLKRLARGETEGLPVESSENSMSRRHKYEAVSLLMHEGRNYVLRVPVDSDQELLRTGNQIESENGHRLTRFHSAVRALFEKSK